MKRRRSLACALALCTAAVSAHAQADLAADVRALSSAHLALGHVVRLKPRLLERGDRLPLPIPADLLNPRDSNCTTVSILGVVGLHFVMRFAEQDPGAPNTAFPEASVAGASEITRCGSSKPYLSGVMLEMRSPRGVVETLVSNAPAGLPRIAEVLPQRDAGTELPLGEPGPVPTAPPLKERLLRLLNRAQREGAADFKQEAWPASGEGTGAGPVPLSAGCHELTLLAEALESSEHPLDLDLELVEKESGARLAIDRSDNADGALSLCLGAPVRGELRFVGAPPVAQLSLAHARWALPAGLPATWGAEPRARLASVAREARFSPQKAPVYSALGVQGSSSLPFEVEPGVCYSALVAPLRGEARSLSLTAFAHAPGELPSGASDSSGVAVAFCAHGARRATLQVEAQGAGLSWLLAVWESGRTAIGVREP